MKLEYFSDIKKYIADCTYDERGIPKNAGFRWHPKNRCWWTDDADKAARLSEYCDETALQKIQETKKNNIEKIAESSAVTSDIDIPVPAGLEYLPYQRAGIQYAVNRDNTLIADEMGLGKTIEAIGVINYLRPDRVLIICPASLRENWRREYQKWSVQDDPIIVWNAKNNNNADKIIINYDIVKKSSEYLKSKTWDIIIYDESHYLKNPKAQRTKSCFEIPAKKRIYLTGTPVLNRPIELYPMLKNTGIDWAQNWYQYVTRYCEGYKTKWGWDVSGSSNSEELGKKLRIELMIRRLKKDVLPALPDKRISVISLPLNDAKKIVNAEIKMKTDYDQSMKEIKNKIAVLRKNKQTETDDYKIAIKNMKSVSAQFAEITKLRHQTTLAKIPLAVEIISDTVENCGHTVVFAHHQDVVNQTAEALRQKKITVATITGATEMSRRQDAVDDFQAGKIQVIIGTIGAMGVGLTLTKSSNVIFLELDWTPAKIHQAEDRCHRIGQKNAVNIMYLIYDNTIDSYIAQMIIDKEKIIEEIIEQEE